MFGPRRIEPGPGQESVWDYPRPPRLEDSDKQIQVVFNGVVIAESNRTKRVLETSHPPVYYIPPEDVKREYFQDSPRSTFCEWKGNARYYTITVGEQSLPNGAWYYPEPTAYFAALRDYIAVYPSKMEACYVNGERVQAQPGDFYGGWVTSDIVGPFKGSIGTMGW
ncbi:DUF427 domain-containing protein [Leptolyngbya sp. FACHB-261]|uniref:DUF427 domain-containing protein n=1 Tax=Leptolyngbya sp. FACHB-261 TaxID=2692806 RepID=UPI0016861238|nr:DUF427 domain-containing protein [Leptolyngbya sp. FACHB-261]MBD2103587.1 DUF427 domain-containing protein [Leptolyngbya sp. FACHB-261]